MVRRIPVALLAVLLGAASLASARAQGSALDARAAATAQPQAQVTGAPVTPAPVPSLAPSPPAEPSVAPGRPGASSPAAALPRIPGVIVPGAGTTQPYATFVKGATVQNGVIDLIRKDDDLYFDLK